MMRALLAASLCAGWALAGTGLAHAQAYPTRPIRIVVPFPAGGPTDGMARIVSDRLGAVLGQTIVVENHGGGAGASIGAKAVATADPDGYTILMTPGGALTTGPAVHRNIGYDPAKVFTPVGLLMVTPNIISVHPSLPVKSLAEVVAYAKANSSAPMAPTAFSSAPAGAMDPRFAMWRAMRLAARYRRRRRRRAASLRRSASPMSQAISSRRIHHRAMRSMCSTIWRSWHYPRNCLARWKERKRSRLTTCASANSSES